MKFSKGIGAAAGLALAAAMASGGIALAARKPPTGNLNIQITGYEVLTPSEGSAGQYTVNGLGQVIGDTDRSLSGDLTYTLLASRLHQDQERLPIARVRRLICIATSVAAANGGSTLIDAASLDVTIDSVEGANAPND
jgi:hypothetical protein